MALTECPECGEEVRVSATSCNRCGRLLWASSVRRAVPIPRLGALTGMGFVLMLAGVGVCFVSLGVGIFALVTGAAIAFVGRFV